MKRVSTHLFILATVLVIAASTITVPQVVNAQKLFPTILPECDQTVTKVGDSVKIDKICGFDDFVQLMVNLFDWGLAALSILSVLFFVIGGTILLVSQGRQQSIERGKAILSNTLLGVFIALGSWLIVNTVIGLLVGNGEFKDVKVFGKNWWGANTCIDKFTGVCSQYELKQGCGDHKNNNIAQLQKLLKQAEGCQSISVDGCFGAETEKMVEAFNKANKIYVSGQTPEKRPVKATWDALYAGKTCIGSQIATIDQIAKVAAPGGSCCIGPCFAYGVDNAEGSNAAHTGCLDMFPDALYSAPAVPQCANVQGPYFPIGTAATAKTKCCITLDNTCYQNANAGWCLAVKGVPNDSTCDSDALKSKCQGTPTICSN